ncbi:NUDIX domain-containing protein [Zoogloea sp.]|uniref:NUDIX hydrolase n=1 Tax=Zoogloea sp. TaxID=49181 RepID=UPI0035AFA9FC
MNAPPSSPVTPDALEAAIATLQAAVGSAQAGLPEPVFQLVSSLTPLINVDLLIHDEHGRCLLTWRHDAFYGPGWHIPGGIIRFKEAAAQRIAAVADLELGCCVTFAPLPIALHEITNPNRDVRGHFISLLYSCRLASPPDPGRAFDPASPRAGDWAWHTGSPDNLIHQQHIYRPYIDNPLAGVWS